MLKASVSFVQIVSSYETEFFQQILIQTASFIAIIIVCTSSMPSLFIYFL
jgi:hypothetical protein